MKQYVSNKFAVLLTGVLISLAILLGISAFLVLRPPRIATNACYNNMQMIDKAKQQWMREDNKTSTNIPSWDSLRPYLHLGPEEAVPVCPVGGTPYILGPVGEAQKCSTDQHPPR
jgi:hypothetical protein